MPSAGTARGPVARLVAVERAGLVVDVFADAVELGVDAFITRRVGGVSAPPYDSLNLGDHVGDDPDSVAENRRRVATALGVTPEHLVIVAQRHGSVVVDGDRATPADEGDAITLTGPERAVGVLVADCAPLLLVDPRAQRLAVVHAGWRGCEAGVAMSAVRSLGSDPAGMTALIGPSISANAYQVGPEVANLFAGIPGVVRPDAGDRSMLDLRAVLADQLIRLGVPDDRVRICAAATDGGATYFSDRAQRPTGRFGLFARWALA